MPISLLDLIAGVGVDNIRWQSLLHSLAGVTTNKRGESRVTFLTRELNATHVALDAAPMVGLIVWIPKADMVRVLDAISVGRLTAKESGLLPQHVPEQSAEPPLTERSEQ